MVFNNVTDMLRQWCEETLMAALEKAAAQISGGELYAPASLSWRAAAELGFRLCALTDAEFDGYPGYLAAVRSLIPVPVTPPSDCGGNDVFDRRPVQAVEEAFLEKLASLDPALPGPDLPYFRVLPEAEARIVKASIRERWDYEADSGWYPLSSVRIRDGEAFFVPAGVFELYADRLRELLGPPALHMYCLGESWPGRPNCYEVSELEGYGGSECFYTPKDYSWAVYCSHEDTVTFAGSITPAVKKLLEKEKDLWNTWQTHGKAFF